MNKNNDKYSFSVDDGEEQRRDYRPQAPATAGNSDRQSDSGDDISKVIEAVDYLKDIIPTVSGLSVSIQDAVNQAIVDLKAGVDTYVSNEKTRVQSEIDQATQQSVTTVKQQVEEAKKIPVATLEGVRKQLADGVKQAITNADIERRVEKAAGKALNELWMWRILIFLAVLTGVLYGAFRLFHKLYVQWGGVTMKNIMIVITVAISYTFFLYWCGWMHGKSERY